MPEVTHKAFNNVIVSKPTALECTANPSYLVDPILENLRKKTTGQSFFTARCKLNIETNNMRNHA